MTNTYEEARAWIDENKDVFETEFELMASSLSQPNDEGVIWQKDIYYFKWRLFHETFKPINESLQERIKLIQMAL